MLFLIDYHPRSGKLVEMKTFDDSQLEQACDERLERELALYDAGIETERELVILRAETEAHVRYSHGRYFYTVEELFLQAGLDLSLFREPPAATPDPAPDAAPVSSVAC